MPLTRREYLSTLALAVPPRARRPNILLILTDQQSISALSASGNPYLRTPNMDRLVREGTTFQHSWCASPVCSPSRSSIVTGCFPTRTGVIYNGDQMSRSVPTLGEVFRAAGYETAWCGKWHLPRAFPGARAAGREPRSPVDERGFEFLPFSVSANADMPFGDFTDRPIAEAAAAFLQRRSAKPFLLAVSLHNPHDICYQVMDKLPSAHPARADFAVPADRLPPLPPNHESSATEPEFIRVCRQRKHYGEENTYTSGWDETRWRRYLYAYYRLTERVDRCVGLVLDALRDTGLDDDTIVVFTSDHGEGMAAHRWVVKLMLWHEVVSVPLVVRWPKGIAAGRRDARTLASGVDILPTLCDLAGVDAPAGIHGTSLASALKKQTSVRRPSVFAQLAPDTKDPKLQGRAISSGRYKYVHFSSGANPELLFDLQSDPGELHNLAEDPGHSQILQDHRRMLQGWIQKTEAQG